MAENAREKFENLPTRYEPRPVEDRWYRHWMEHGHFGSVPRPDRKPYTIVIPPPNVTGALHMGHALNNTLQDILIRWRRMQGFAALWVPGTDHAGIATQSVVERDIAKKEGKNRHQIGREELLKRIWKWKEEYGERILLQLRKLGSSCDWSRTRFTLDEGLSRAVRTAFVRLFREGLIYRGRRLVNWCPRCRTALSDEEVEMKEVKGHLWHIRYPMKGDPSRSVTVATTRPETMLGDTAVAVHPEDERYRDLVGKALVLPLMDREIPVVADAAVDRTFGTGAVKVTPAHDPTDFEIGERHGLAQINILNEDGSINRNGGRFAGLDRLRAREDVVEALRVEGLLAKVEEHVHQVGHCYRTGDMIEPFLSLQWFVRTKPLAALAIEATRSGRVKFHPERWTDFYLQWLENVRDWCISRQIWWGHRIPIWYAPDGTPIAAEDEEAARAEARMRFGDAAAARLQQDEDVLDTWFSSGLWPFSTLGWPQETEDLRFYYPTSTLVTDRGIIFFWVARMVMMGEKMMGREPFSHVYIHGTILDRQGRKMSKSLKNGIDPLALIDGGRDENSATTYERPFGADAVRFSLATLSTEGQDLKLWPERFDDGLRFANKMWNAGRFSLTQLAGGGAAAGPDLDLRPGSASLRFEDRWILSRLHAAIEETTAALEGFRYCEAAGRIREFVWNEFCDWYVELVKFRIRSDEEGGAAGSGDDAAVCRRVLAHVFDAVLRLLHPVCPFITEELWHLLAETGCRRVLDGGSGAPAESVILAPWPSHDPARRENRVEEEFEWVKGAIGRVRKIRQDRNVAASRTPDACIICVDETVAGRILPHRELILNLTALKSVRIGTGIERPAGAAVEVLPGMEVAVPLAQASDPEREKKAREEQVKRRAEIASYIEREEGKLRNERFLAKAPPAIVEATRNRIAEARAQLEAIERLLK
jgi:valyl-tRNA synthetase